VFPAITAHTTLAARPPKARAYAIPVVRPVPPRPSGAGTTATW
jgi:hypothetical protein